MAKVYFRYGTMNSGKSIDLLKVAHNYEQQGRNVLIFSPAIDTRSPANMVESRIGISHEAIPVYDDTSIRETVLKEKQNKDIECILVDEAQFLSSQNVADLCAIADFLDIPVIAYGLKTDFRGKLFEGSKVLLEYADKIEEIKTTCHCCGKKAIFNARYVDGKFTTKGNQIHIGGNESYKPLCREHYTRELINETERRWDE